METLTPRQFVEKVYGESNVDRPKRFCRVEGGNVKFGTYFPKTDLGVDEVGSASPGKPTGVTWID